MIFIDPNEKKQSNFVLNKAETYLFLLFNYSGKLVVKLRSPGIRAHIMGIFEGRGSDSFNLETIQHHDASESFSELFIKGVFYDNASFIHNGIVRIEKKALKARACQKNQSLMMSPGSSVESKPFLEILANDVFCTHGSAVGKLNSDQIYYLQSRGLERSEAEKLLIRGFVEEFFLKMAALGMNNKILQGYRKKLTILNNA